MLCLPHSSWVDHPICIYWRIQLRKFYICYTLNSVLFSCEIYWFKGEWLGTKLIFLSKLLGSTPSCFPLANPVSLNQTSFSGKIPPYARMPQIRSSSAHPSVTLMFPRASQNLICSIRCIFDLLSPFLPNPPSHCWCHSQPQFHSNPLFSSQTVCSHFQLQGSRGYTIVTSHWL